MQKAKEKERQTEINIIPLLLQLLLFLPSLTTAHFGLLANLTNALNDATFTIELGTTACEGFLLNATSALLSGTPLINITFNDFFLSGLTSLQSLEQTSPLTRLFNRTSWLTNWANRFGTMNITIGSRWPSWGSRLASFNGTGLLSTIIQNKITLLNNTLQSGIFGRPLFNLFSG